ncbi:MAG: NAD(P) transhydrogenase subunit alpha [Bacteroidetes bacterium]|nr:NAD(P) transhydrogenase subunit alpha [Bacteroidota bacterium]
MESIASFFLQNLDMIFIVILAIYMGMEVIANVPSLLHTPLMSGSNAISGVVIMGSVIVLGHAKPDDYLSLSLGFLAVVLAMINVMGGFAVTGRMLAMFKKKK